MRNIKLKLMGSLCFLILLNLVLYAESLTDGKGLFKSNKLIEKVLFKDSKLKVFRIEIEEIDNISIKVLNDLENGITFFKYKEDIVSFAGEMIIVDILSNKKNDSLYIFSKSIHSDMSCYDVTLISNKGLKVLGSYEGTDIYGEANFQKLDEIYKGVNYIFKKNKNKEELLYSTKNHQYVTYKNGEFISKSKIKEYFQKDKKTKNLYLSQKDNFKDNWEGIYIYNGFDMATGSVFKSKWIFTISENKCHLMMSGVELALDSNDEKLEYEQILDEECSISKVKMSDTFSSKKLQKSILKLDSLLITTKDSKYVLVRDQNEYYISGYNVTLPRNQNFLHLLKKEKLNIPKFKKYSILNTYTNPNKPIIQKSFGRLYRTLLKKALKEKKPEFAGKHIIAQWGCDDGKNECTTGGIIDASTGKATKIPFKYYAHNGSKEIIYKLNSSLIVFAGDFEFDDGRKSTNEVRFYEFKDGEFLFLKASEYKK